MFHKHALLVFQQEFLLFVPALIPQILVHPASCIANSGLPVKLKCEAIGYHPLMYTWFKDESKITRPNQQNEYMVSIC